MLGKETIDGLLVFGKAVRPEIEAHQLARCPQLVFDERQGHFARPGLTEPRECEGLRFLECLHERTRQPRMLLGECLSDTERVHDRKQLCARIPVGSSLVWIVEEIPNLRMALVKAGRRTWTDDGVDLPRRQKSGDGFAFGGV